MSTTVRKLLDDVTHDVGELGNKKNINDVMKLHTNISTKIKTANVKIQKLKQE